MDLIMLQLVSIFALGFGAGYGLREIISRRRRKVVRRVSLFHD
jgi:hypothetical protein